MRENPSLKYLFTCIYTDDTVFEQTQEDVSAQDPKRSALFDIDQSRLKAFALYGPVNEGLPDDQIKTYVVNLLNGTFAVNGVHFRMHEEGEVFGPFKLIFWRRHKHVINTITEEEESHQTVYRLGWQSPGVIGRRKKNGQTVLIHRTIERVMEID